MEMQVPFEMEKPNFEILIHGFDTVQCAYSMEQRRKRGIDFQFLREKKESIRELRNKEPVAVKIGSQDFLLHPYGTASGYPILISNEDFKIEMGEFNRPNFFVTFRSQALWRKSAFEIHDKFIDWGVMGVGFANMHLQ